MRVEVCESPTAAAVCASALLADLIANAIEKRGVAAIALSGGKTPVKMFHELAGVSLEWLRVHIFQVDERVVAPDDARRNLRSVRTAFRKSGIPMSQIHAMPVDKASLDAGLEEYAAELRVVAGAPPIVDVIHLGLGEDGHTASLFPGDPAVDARGEVALSGVHGGVCRMTLTLGAINRARARLWLVTGRSKQSVVRGLRKPHSGLIANRVRTDDTLLILDRDASDRER